jgi:hypothetical protein
MTSFKSMKNFTTSIFLSFAVDLWLTHKTFITTKNKVFEAI